MNRDRRNRSAIRPCTWVYLLMCGLTLVTWAVGATGVQGLWVALLVLGFALLKGQLVGDWFMGLHGVRGVWRWAVSVWLLAIGILISIAFIIANGD